MLEAFWVFVGIVAGALIQFALGQVQQRIFRRNAKKLFQVETEINRRELEKLRTSVQRKKERFVAGQQTPNDFFFDLGDFNYRIADPMINSGLFHSLLGADGVAAYFRFANALRSDRAIALQETLRQEHEHARSVAFLDWVLDTKIPEWDELLQTIEQKLR